MFHVLRLNLCVALSPACPDRQYLNASGVCVDCTICKESDKKLVLRPCSARGDTICGSVSEKNRDLPGAKIKDATNQYLTVNDGAELSKEPKSTADIDAAYYYYDDDTDDYDYDNNGESISASKISNSSVKSAKKSKKTSTAGSSSESSKKSKLPKPPLYNFFNTDLLNENISVVDPDTLMQRTKKLKKMKFKESSIKIDDHTLKIGDTKFKIGDGKNDDGRWLQLSHPHIVDKKIYVDLGGKPLNKKGSTFFSSGEKKSDQEYFNEMAKLLNETSSVLNGKHPIVNQTTKDDDYDNNNMLKNLDDVGDDDDDDDEDEEDEDSEEDEDEDEDDDDEDDDEPLIYNNFIPGNNSDRTDSGERTDIDMDDDYDLSESDFYQDRTFKQSTNTDIIAEPFVSTANWQILILVAAMSACLLFFIVVSAYICIFMRKREFKTTFVAGTLRCDD